MNKVLTLRLYKSFLRESQKLIKNEKSLWLNIPPDFKKFQTSTVLDANRHIDIVKALLPPKIQDISCHFQQQLLNGNDLKRLCSIIFREHPADAIDAGFEAFRMLRIQTLTNKMTSVSNVNNMRVILSVAFNELQSQAMREGYVYYYRVTVENNCQDSMKLLGSNGFVTQVPKFADGVIGLQPIIAPGEAFEYMSRVVLNHSEGGTMSGAFLMQNTSTNEKFELDIAKCHLNPVVV